MSGTIITAAPSGEARFEGYRLRVNGAEAPLYACRVSAMPFNQVWPGYQRPLDQTELAGFAYWDMAAPVRLHVPAVPYAWTPSVEAPLPPEPPVPLGAPESVTLVPYGCTKFRVSMFPLMQSP